MFLTTIQVCFAQKTQKQITYSVGLFGGLTSTVLFDEGINQDPRYQAKYGAKPVPFGVHLGVDLDGFGFMIDPQITAIGQSFNILNTVGGQVGIRAIKMNYIQLPLSYKKHIIDLSFFKVSFIAGISGSYLLSGQETISHSSAKLLFPLAVQSKLPSEYKVEYDGVVSPLISNYQTLSTADFKRLQIIGSFGIRSDWDITEHARISFDFRINGGIFDPRTNTYLQRVSANETLYEKPGSRKDIFASFTIGYSRYLTLETKSKGRNTKPFVQPGPKRRKPK